MKALQAELYLMIHFRLQLIFFRFKQWIDEVSRMFGGLDICSVEVLQSKTGEYFIYDVSVLYTAIQYL